MSMQLFWRQFYNKSDLNLYVAPKISKRAPSEFRSRVAMEDETDMIISLINLLQKAHQDFFYMLFKT